MPVTIPNYKTAQEFLFERSAQGMKLGLRNMRELVRRLDLPQGNFQSIHIAGTNGKGSTAAILESILRAAGYKTGLNTSPHLIDLRERIRVNGEKIKEEDLLLHLNRMLPHIEAAEASFFEILTAMSFLHFAGKEIDIAVVETGLGGRLDATSVLNPSLTLITSIGKDHTGILGSDLLSIAREKAGIFKSGVPCLTSIKKKTILDELRSTGRPLGVEVISSAEKVTFSSVRCREDGTVFNATSEKRRYRDLHLALVGRHQLINCGLALLAVEFLRRQGREIPEEAVRQGLADVVWPARLQLVKSVPAVLIDSAHNAQGAGILSRALKEIFRSCRKHLVFGVLRDKDHYAMLRSLAPHFQSIILTTPDNHRAADPRLVAEASTLRGKELSVIPEPEKALSRALEQAEGKDLLVAAGSIFLVGEILRLLGRDYPEILP